MSLDMLSNACFLFAGMGTKGRRTPSCIAKLHHGEVPKKPGCQAVPYCCFLHVVLVLVMTKYIIYIYIYCIYMYTQYIYMYIMYRHRTWTCHKYYIYIHTYVYVCVCIRSAWYMHFIRTYIIRHIQHDIHLDMQTVRLHDRLFIRYILHHTRDDILFIITVKVNSIAHCSQAMASIQFMCIG